MKAFANGCFASLLLVAVAGAQTDWYLRGGAATARLAGPEPASLVGPRAHATLPGGDWRVVFGVDANGHPGALGFSVPDGGLVRLATEPAGAEVATRLDPNGAGWTDCAGTDTLRTTGGSDATDYRLAATVAGDVSCGLIARFRGPDEFYAFLVDLERREVRLERRLGPKPLVLATAPLPNTSAAARELVLQVHGFRLQAIVDGTAVLQIFDGGIQRGAYGMCWRGPMPGFAAMSVSPPAVPRASQAMVAIGSNTIELHAATTVSPGHWWFVELVLDRPHPLVPLDANGIEPWLCQRPAAPQAMLCDWRGSLGPAALGVVPDDGLVRARCTWPELPAVRNLGAMARLALVGADGSALAGHSPATMVEFRAIRAR
ncbi:MAG: hypothetical protein JNK15_12120 [Planctomycetes bacterium]|nr:hypothetical protein [Planctomycetota bacterium]